MKKNLLTLFTLLFTLGVSAQNLVVNPSFEQTSSNCANFGGEGFASDLAGSWNNANSNVGGDSCSSPDLFSACNLIFGSPAPTHMPNSMLGYQYSRTGTRHAGIILYEPMDNYREYIQGHTSAPLQAGVSYCVSMYVSLGNDVPYATNNMGVYFTNTPYMRNPCPGTTNSLINVTPQLNYSCAPITDTTANWFRLQWNYVATGGEQYFTIGNFFNNANTTVVTVGSGFLNPYAYYYIDDVSIVATTECCYADLPPAQVVCVSDAPFNLTATGGVGSSCSGTISGTWSGSGITNAANGTFDPATAGVGSHTLTYTMSCGYTATTIVSVSGCATLSVCKETNGDLTVTGGTGPYTWNVQVQGQDCSACSTVFPIPPCSFPPGCSVAVLQWQQYTTGSTITPPSFPLQVLDADGGVLEITDLASLPECSGNSCALTLQLVTSTGACGGVGNGSATVSASNNIGMVSYTWNSVPAQSGPTASGLQAGEYVVTAIDKIGCEKTLTVVIADQVGIVSAGADVNICTGDAVQLTATGGTAYTWDQGAGTGATVSVSPSETTTYTVTASGTGGCGNTDQVTVNVFDVPAVSITTPASTLCNNASPLQVDVSPLGGTLSGSGISGSSFDPAVAGVGEHVITYEYAETPECPGSDQVTFTVDLCTSVEEATSMDGFLIHPNPSRGLFVVEYAGELQGMVDVTVTDLTGRTVLAPASTALKGMKLQLDITPLTAGQYLLQISQNGKRINTIRLTKNDAY